MSCWAKCDMLYTLSYSRLNAPKIGKLDGKRQYNFIVLPSSTMCDILTGVLAGMGIVGAVKHENDIYQVFDFPLDSVVRPW